MVKFSFLCFSLVIIYFSHTQATLPYSKLHVACSDVAKSEMAGIQAQTATKNICQNVHLNRSNGPTAMLTIRLATAYSIPVSVFHYEFRRILILSYLHKVRWSLKRCNIYAVNCPSASIIPACKRRIKIEAASMEDSNSTSIKYHMKEETIADVNIEENGHQR